jgi:hypothetical protein
MNCLNRHQHCRRRHHQRRHNLAVVIATVILVIISAADGGIGDVGGPSRRSPRLVFASALSPPTSLPESASGPSDSAGSPSYAASSARSNRPGSGATRRTCFAVDASSSTATARGTSPNLTPPKIRRYCPHTPRR